jgi:UDP-N-acetylglucosamine diphosphorylase / glucose-1-phosphate thymidylyltransferase / UDP-N-acetylgalactosamine diphosphorylase / glucosamine-1-phosphate N-acetyltransferase / galactosamine-1-phosphate N-acetyltransferase
MSLVINDLIGGFPVDSLAGKEDAFWLIPSLLAGRVLKIIAGLGDDYVVHNNVAIHKTANVEMGAVLKGPVVVGSGCFVACNAYLRDGVYLGNNVVAGPGCEVKASVIMNHTHLAHFNFVGDSIIGNNVNFEAGAIVCNHWNERANKEIIAVYKGRIFETGIEKFGALVGDGAKIGANAVLSPGTILGRNSIVNRLELVEQKLG